MKIIEKTLNKNTSMYMARRKLGIERNQLTSLEGQHAKIANTRDEVIKIAKKFYKRWSR